MKKLLIASVLFFIPVIALAQTASFNTSLSYGLTGSSAVSALQEFLTEQGVYHGPVSGNFFALTLAGVKAFQKAEGITPVSGFFGPVTRGVANTVLAGEVGTNSEGNATTTKPAVDLSLQTNPATTTYTPPIASNPSVPQCPQFSTGTYPNCIKLSCPSGTSGTYPYCNTIPTPTPIPTSTPPITTPTSQPCTDILCENFDSYSSGSIVGQGGWLNRANGLPYVVENTVVQAGSEALYNNNTGADSVITKNSGTAQANGQESFYIQTQNNANWGNYNLGENVQMGVFQGSWDGPSRATLAFMKDGHVAYLDVGLNKYVDFDTYTDNAWTKVTIQWRASDATARYQVNNDAWTNWMPFTGGSSFTGFDTVGFVTFQLGTGGVYIDSLQ